MAYSGEITFDTEVRDLSEIDKVNPLSKYLRLALLPNSKTNSLTEMVSGYTFSLGSAPTWNSDGSITATGGDVSNTNTVGDNIHQFNFEEKGTVFRPSIDDVICFVDIKFATDNLGGNAAQFFKIEAPHPKPLGLIFERGSNGKAYRLAITGGSSNGIGFYEETLPIFGTERHQLVFHYIAATTTTHIYLNGKIFATKVGTQALVDGDQSFTTLTAGIGAKDDKFYNSQVYIKRGGFAQDEADEIIANPYGVFTTSVEKAQAYGLVLKNATEYVSFDRNYSLGSTLNDTPRTFDLEIKYRIDSTHSGSSGLLAGNYGTTGSTHHLCIDSSNELRFESSNGTIAVTNATFRDGNTHIIKLSIKPDGETSKIFLDGDEIWTGNHDGWFDISVAGSYWLPQSPLGGHLESLRFTVGIDGIDQVYWDFNKTHGETVVDYYGDRVATLKGFSTDSGNTTSKWQPLNEIDTFTVGEGKDYVNAYSMIVAQNRNPNHVQATFYGTTEVGGDPTNYMDSAHEFTGGLTLKADNPFDGNIDGKTTLQRVSASNDITWGAETGRLYLKGLVLKTIVPNLGGVVLANSFRRTDIYADSCAFLGSGGTSNDKVGISSSNTQGLNTWEVKNSLISNFSGAGARIRSGSKAAFYNVIIYKCNLAGSGFRGGYVDDRNSTIFNNLIVVDNKSKDIYQTPTGDSKVVTSDTTGDIPSISTTGMFVDEANGDYRINRDWADTNLVSKGWNGSNICSNYYVEDLPPTTITVSFDNTIVNLTGDNISLTANTFVLFDDSDITTTIEDISLQSLIEVLYDDSKVSCSVSLMDIQRHTEVTYSDAKVVSDIKGMDITRRTSLIFEDSVINTSIEKMVVVSHDLSYNLVFEDTTVSLNGEDIVLSRKTDVVFEDAVISTDITGMTLQRHVSLEFEDTTIDLIIEDFTIRRNVISLEFDNAKVQLTGNDLNLKRYTDLEYSETVIGLTLDNIYLVTEQLPAFKNVVLKDNKVLRRLGKITKQFGVKKND